MKWLEGKSAGGIGRSLRPLADREWWTNLLTRDIGLKLVSLGMAFALWAFVNATERDTEQAFQVPLEIRSIPPSLMVTSPRVDFIDLRVSGPRTLLGRIDRTRLSIPLDLGGVRPGPAVFRITGDSLNLPRGVKIVRIAPAQITLDLERIVRRTVPVRLQLVGKLPPGLRIEDRRVSPETVEIIGPASAVEEIKGTETEPLDLSEASPGIFERELALPPISDYISFSAQRVAAQLHIAELEIEREIHNVPVAVRNTMYRATIEPPEIRLTIRGPKSVVESLELQSGEVYIDAAGAALGRHKRAPQADLPPGVEIVQLSPAMVELRLSKGQKG